jgi:zinc finger protein
MRIASPCPACGQQTVEYTAITLDLPYFGEVLQTVFICSSCGFRHSDIIIGRVRTPKRHTYRTKGPDDMAVRVVRSTSGTIKIPELGVLIEPGPASDAFVSNIEGILVRVEAVVKQLQRDAETPDARRECDRRLQMIEEARAGGLPVTLIIEDPYGNSLIASPKTRVEDIPAEQAQELPTGDISFDVSEIGGAAPADGDGTQKR